MFRSDVNSSDKPLTGHVSILKLQLRLELPETSNN